MAKIWLDDIRPAPQGFIWCTSVNKAKYMIAMLEYKYNTHQHEEDKITLIDCDHDMGDFACRGGDGIKLLDWLVETNRFYPIRLHTQNAVGLENMRRMISRYWPASAQ